MIDRTVLEDCVFRIAARSLTFDDSLSPAEQRRVLDTEVAWCLAPLRRADGLDLDTLRRLVEGALVDPTRHRAAVVAALYALAPEQSRL